MKFVFGVVSGIATCVMASIVLDHAPLTLGNFALMTPMFLFAGVGVAELSEHLLG